jgi:hypothetical protein
MNEVELLAMDYLLRGDHPALITLRDQLTVATVAGRNLTGVGFFTQFMVPPSALRLPSAGRLIIGDVYAELIGLRYGASFILFVEGGALHTLEGVTTDEAWPQEVRVSRMFYVRPERPGCAQVLETTERDLSWAIKEGTIQRPS